MKYRIKMKNGRIIGPFIPAQIGELFTKGHLDGTEDCESFPAGKWKPLKEYPELKDCIMNIITGNGEVIDVLEDNASTSDTVVNLVLGKKKIDNAPKIDRTRVQSNVSEFDYSAPVEEVEPDYEELDKQIEEEHKTKLAEIEAQALKDAAMKRMEEEEELDKTMIVRPHGYDDSSDDDKTIITNQSLEFLKEQEALKQKEEEAAKERALIKEREEDEVPLEDQATQFIDIKKELSEIKSSSQASEIEIENEERKALSNYEEAKPESEEEDQEEEIKPKRKTRPILMLVFLLLIGYLLLDDETDPSKPIVPLWADVQFPISKEVEDIGASNEAFRKGKEQLLRRNYEGKLKAGSYFKSSLQNKFSDNPALGYLIYTYADLLKNVKKDDYQKAVNTMYNLVEIGKSKLLIDVNVCMGSALFYSEIGKKQTALNVMENFLRVGKPNVQFLITYLNVLIDNGKLIDAAKAYKKLKAMKNLPHEAYLAMARYLVLEEQHDNAAKVLVTANKTYDNSVQLLLAYSEYLLRNNDVKNLAATLKAVQILRAEHCPVYYSKYLELMGMLSALQGDNNAAVVLFKEALKVKDTKELRSKLASLEIGGAKAVQGLIKESKVVELMRKARLEAERYNWEEAFHDAIEAADMIDTYVPSKLMLAEIQIERGYYKAAISTLEKLHSEFPLDGDINFLLVDAYVSARLFDKAQHLINKISSTSLMESYYYPSMLANFFDAKDNVLVASSWYRKSLRLNPLNDREFYAMAKMLMRYNKFKDVKILIQKALYLDPENIDYLIVYSKVLYELEGSDAAIGYLRGILERHPGNSKIEAQIAIYYHQSGQLKHYEREAKKILSGSDVASSFYSYLIDAAVLDENYDDMVKYSREYIKQNPGNLVKRQQLGEFLFSRGKYSEAKEVFEEIIDRLPNYPKTHYYLAKIAMQNRDYKRGLELAKLERDYTPNFEYGFYIAGEIYRQMEKYPESVKMLEQAIARNGNSVESLLSLAWIKSHQRFYDEAKEYYLRALKEEPGNAEAHKEIGYTYKAMGQSTLAIESFKVYLELNPNARDKSRILQEIKMLK